MFENVSDTVYKAVYDSVAKYGLADEFVVTLCNVFGLGCIRKLTNYIVDFCILKFTFCHFVCLSLNRWLDNTGSGGNGENYWQC